jgi:hypothetical protein
VKSRGKNISGKCKGPEVGFSMVYARNRNGQPEWLEHEGQNDEKMT